MCPSCVGASLSTLSDNDAGSCHSLADCCYPRVLGSSSRDWERRTFYNLTDNFKLFSGLVILALNLQSPLSSMGETERVETLGECRVSTCLSAEIG